MEIMNLNFPKNEEKILKFWQEKKIFEKSLEKTKDNPRFVFYEGPPFANGLPGIHHLLARAFKDIILRYKTMQGFFVERRAGWDTHGLPTEMETEKKLNIKSKKEIEKLGVQKFIEECRNNVFTYKKEWEEFSKRIGFWLDFDNAYVTCSNDYIESLWWILKQIWDNGLLYQDYKVVPYCSRCGTSLSSHEVAQGYKKVTEESITVKFELVDEPGTYVLAWTTTPWTLPGNVAAAINPKFTYAKVKINNEYLILAKERIEACGVKGKIVEEFRGKDLLGLEYKPLFPFTRPGRVDKKAYFIIAGDFVSLEEGTGLVHIAPAFGEDDMEVAKENNLPVLMTVDEEGRFKEEIKDWAGMLVTEQKTNILIKKNLDDRNLLYGEQTYEHDYPFCWRCKEKLIYYAKNSWFIKMSAIKKDLIKNSEEINWEPKYIKKGRFGEWLKEIKDWNLSRERYWGTPLPIWECDKCGEKICIEGIKELEKLSGEKIADLHRPFVDKITFKCERCDGIMRRVLEVIDCWFDSGSMPFAQWHYPFENKNKIDKGEFFPADFISEGIDQTRGWFYTLLAISTLLQKGVSYKNVICLGLVLDNKGQKMSKSRGNIIKPQEVINKFGADCARFYFYTVNPASETKRFDFKDAQSLFRRFFDTLWQSCIFFSTYAGEDFKPKKDFRPKNLLNQWIVSRLENLNSQVSKNLDSYDVVSAARALLDFVDDLSNWYIRRSRRRFQKPETKEIKEEASQTLYYVLLKLTKLIAPFTPFIAEELYQKLNGVEKSVHLDSYPKSDKKLINAGLEEKMEKIREIITEALALRAEAGIKVRQPLAELKIKNKLDEDLLELIKDEVNVKKITFSKEVKLDTKISKELEQEGRYRELVRNVNKIRKEMKFTPKDVIIIDSTVNVINVEDFKKEVGAKEFNIKKQVDGKEIKIAKEKHYIRIKKL